MNLFSPFFSCFSFYLFASVPPCPSHSFDLVWIFVFELLRSSAQIFVNCVEMKSRETNCRGRMRTLLAYRGDCRGSVLIGTLDWQRGNLQCFPMKTKVFQAHVPDFEISGNTPAQAIDRDSENVPVERDEIVGDNRTQWNSRIPTLFRGTINTEIENSRVA